MKNLIKLLSLFTVTGLLLASCEGPMGPAGENGIAGIDANESCTQCHTNNQIITAKMAQWAASTHATGGNSERNAYDCAPCHTSQGFLEVNAAGGFISGPGLIAASGTVSNPNQQNCYTCHDIHNTFTDDDWDLTKTAATVASHSIDGTTPVSVDLGKANMCTGCHQGRALDYVLDLADNSTTITAESYRWGIHHGPQYNLVIGKGLYEFEGSEDYSESENHITAKTTNACVDCHMGEAYGTQAGGHTMNVGYEYHEALVPNLPASCETCHEPDSDMDLGDILADLQDEVTIMLDELRVALETAGVKKPDVPDNPATPENDPKIYNYIMYTGSGPSQVILPQTEMMLAAFTNFQAITEDRSLGMHNPAYIKTILANTTEAVIAVTPVK